MSTSTERSRKCREKIKANQEKFQDYKKKDRERKKEEYWKKKNTLSEKEKLEILGVRSDLPQIPTRI